MVLRVIQGYLMRPWETNGGPVTKNDTSARPQTWFLFVILEEECWRRNHRKEIIGEEAWMRTHGAGIMWEES